MLFVDDPSHCVGSTVTVIGTDTSWTMIIVVSNLHLVIDIKPAELSLL